MSNERYELNKNLAQMLKGGVIMDVTTPEQARIAQEAGACAVMALERIPADIRAAGGVARMSDPAMIKGIQNAVTIPVMAKCRIGHFAEAQILEAIEIDYIDESEVLSPADDKYHIDKTKFKVPFVCGAKDLGEALRRINEGASMIRTKGEPGTGDVVQAVRHMRAMNAEIRRIQKATGITTVFVTHDQEEAMSISDLIVVMKDGVVQQIGKPQAVYDSPVNLFVAKFLGTPPINVFDGEVKDGHLYIGEEAVLAVPGVANQSVTAAIRPEGFTLSETGALSCDLSRVEVMGRDISVVSTHPKSQNVTIRSIISAENAVNTASQKVRFDLKPNKVFLFQKESGTRIDFG